MKRLILVTCLAVAGWSGAGLAAHPALAASLCVGGGPGCYSTIQAALTAAHNGDVIHLGPGTFAGGITITKRVQIIGAGAGSTIIQGGGPVVTIGTADGTSEPTVSITGVTITGGLNTSLPSPSNTRGGGILVLPSAPNQPGVMATVTNTVITWWPCRHQPSWSRLPRRLASSKPPLPSRSMWLLSLPSSSGT